MNSSTYRRPGAFSTRPSSSPIPPQDGDPSESDSSSSSQVTAQSRSTQSPQPSQSSQFARPLYPASSTAGSTTSVNNFSRPSPNRQLSGELPLRAAPQIQGHRRQHSQGFFEPSLPSATSPDQTVMANLTASQIAAQAAMQHQSQASQQQSRQRATTIPSPHQSPPSSNTGRRKPPPIQTVSSDNVRKPTGPQTPGRQAYNGVVGGNSAAAATAANAAFPRSAQVSPNQPNHEIPEKDQKLRSEKSKLKLFSKPKGTSTKDLEKEKPLPSPNKIGAQTSSGLKNMVNPSVTSFADSVASSTSLYSTNNTSTSTLVPSDRQTTYEKEKAHKHNFLSRQKNKLKDRIADDHTSALSSASSNSKPLDINAPSSLYSFAPAPSSPATSSFSGLDLRHGGRALREKKKEEKSQPYAPPFAPKKADIERVDWATSSALNAGAGHAPSLFSAPSSSHATEVPTGSAALQGFGLKNMRFEDIWAYLKAKLLVIFEGEELRTPVEVLNRFVTEYIQGCIHQRTPTIITDDLRDLLNIGFTSLDHTLYSIPERGLVSHLVNLWLFVFGTVLPYMQAVFLPLDLEFKGHGPLMTAQEAADFWGANPDSTDHAFGNEFDVRRIVLISYRDNVLLMHYDTLKNTFSRLSLDSINAGVSPVVESFGGLLKTRPGTAASLDPGVSSFNSQGSTLLGDGSRSRATSNLSAPELPSFGSPPARSIRGPQGPLDSSQVTETVGRMLQCVSVLASVQSGDDEQEKMEDLAKLLKLNWLGRGRTGRNRRGFVGGKVKMPAREASDQGMEQQQSRL
ncbi:hypothetical protein ACLMJK_005220 [Lecanora helva]